MVNADLCICVCVCVWNKIRKQQLEKKDIRDNIKEYYYIEVLYKD